MAVSGCRRNDHRSRHGICQGKWPRGSPLLGDCLCRDHPQCPSPPDHLYILFWFPQIFPRGSTGREWILRLLPDAETTFIVALSIYAGAYLTEIFYAGIFGRLADDIWMRVSRSGSVDSNRPLYHDANHGPDGAPSLSNNFISLFKDTSIAVAIAVPELTWAARKISTDYFRVIEAWLTAGALYLIAPMASLCSCGSSKDGSNGPSVSASTGSYSMQVVIDNADLMQEGLVLTLQLSLSLLILGTFFGTLRRHRHDLWQPGRSNVLGSIPI